MFQRLWIKITEKQMELNRRREIRQLLRLFNNTMEGGK